MHIPKKGLRALGIAESFAGRKRSILAGVVMRKDLRIDGFVWGEVTVGGMDATDTIIGMVQGMKRRDINVIMLSGCVIAWFNIIDPYVVFDTTGIPVIGVTYEASEGLLADLEYHFPSDMTRIDAYKRLGERVPHLLCTGQTVFPPLSVWVPPPGHHGSSARRPTALAACAAAARSAGACRVASSARYTCIAPSAVRSLDWSASVLISACCGNWIRKH